VDTWKEITARTKKRESPFKPSKIGSKRGPRRVILWADKEKLLISSDEWFRYATDLLF